MIVCVVGGGPAGMMAAVAAAENGNKVMLFEQNEKLGKKLFLTGKGRCNMTNACPVEELFDNIVTNPKFLYSAFYAMDNSKTIGFFNECGLKTKTERGGRVFPVSDHSSDVITTLAKRLNKLGVEVRLNTRVTGINTFEDSIASVIIKSDKGKEDIKCDALILATGGMSYPQTGSDGTSFAMLDGLSVGITKCEPSLVPFETKDVMITDMQGLSLKNVALTVLKGKKEIYSGFGEMMFTHFGLSGPLVLSASAYVHEADYAEGIVARIDLKPALSDDELDKRVLRDFEQNMNRNSANSLGKLLPGKLITAVIAKSGIDPARKVNVISKNERRKLVEVLKNFDIPVCGNRGFNEAIITRGGVKVKEIDPRTMESRKIKGLYFAGEMIDTDALTGGFNLQIAWSTGNLAGKCIQ